MTSTRTAKNAAPQTTRKIEVCAHWRGLDGPTTMGWLTATPVRGKEVFAFEYDREWLDRGLHTRLDPNLGLFGGRQYPTSDRKNFGIFLDSSPDRWGRVLMERREAQQAREERRPERTLLESDYLLGVHDGHRMGALRFRMGGPFLDDNREMAAPPWTSLSELEYASLQLERDDAESRPEYAKWLSMLISPGGSLGGARPKASVVDDQGGLWIAKFPSRSDPVDMGAWEWVVHELAGHAGVEVPQAQLRKFGSQHHTFLSKRFDRTPSLERLHFASAMTLLERNDGDDFTEGASYLEMAELLKQAGANPTQDIRQLWRRIVFNICVSNVDDHLRNHGFMLEDRGWTLAPAYDMNPDPNGSGLMLNISDTDNALDLELAMEVAEVCRVKRAKEITAEVMEAISTWREKATQVGLSRAAQDRMERAFRHAT